MNTKILSGSFIILTIFIIGSIFFLGRTDKNRFFLDEVSKKNSQPISSSHKPVSKVSTAIKKITIRSKTNVGKISKSDLDIALESKMNILSLFKSLQRIFIKSTDLGSHLNDVYDYLMKNFDKKTAEALFKIYSKYIKCDQLLSSKMPSLTNVESLQDVLNAIDYVSDFRKDYLGDQLYNALYADSATKKKFIVKRNYILKNKDLYSYEKKAQIEDLNNENNTYAKEVEPVRPFDKYQEALNLYSKDLTEMSPDEIKEKKEALKEEIYPEGTLERLKLLHAKDSIYNKKVSNFYSNKEEIESDDSLTDKEKIEKLEKMQASTFTSNELDRFKRNEAIKKGRQALLEKYGLNK